MNWRLAEFVESLFADVVFLGYNYVASLLTLLRRPVRGAIRLYVRFRRAGVRQIAPHTVLFLTIFLLAVAWREFDSANTGQEEQHGRLSSLIRNVVAEDATSIELRQIFIACLVTLVLLDGVTRLAARVAPRGRRRQRLVALLLYSSAAQYVYIWLGAILWLEILTAAFPIPAYGSANQSVWYAWPVLVGLFLAVIAAPFVASLPVARQFDRHLSFSQEGLPHKFRLVGMSMIGVTIFIATLVAGAAVQRWMTPPARAIEYLSCSRTEERVSALVVIRNRARVSHVLEPDHFRIETCEVPDDVCADHEAQIVASSRGSSLPIYVIPGDGTEWIRVEAVVPAHDPQVFCEVVTMTREGLERLQTADGRTLRAPILGSVTVPVSP
jgi:hypothetical protein